MKNRLLFIFLLLFCPSLAQPLEGKISYQGQDVPILVFLPEGYTKGQTPPLMVTLPPGPGTADMVRGNLCSYWLSEGLRRGYIVVARATRQTPSERQVGRSSRPGPRVSRHSSIALRLAGCAVGSYQLSRRTPTRWRNSSCSSIP